MEEQFEKIKNFLKAGTLFGAMAKLVIRHTIWNPDCGGKADFDSPLIGLSCRYYPDNTAYAHILFYIEGTTNGSYVTLASAEFIGNTQTEVRAKVEEWARSKIMRVAHGSMVSLETNQDKAKEEIVAFGKHMLPYEGDKNAAV